MGKLSYYWALFVRCACAVQKRPPGLRAKVHIGLQALCEGLQTSPGLGLSTPRRERRAFAFRPLPLRKFACLPPVSVIIGQLGLC